MVALPLLCIAISYNKLGTYTHMGFIVKLCRKKHFLTHHHFGSSFLNQLKTENEDGEKH